MAASCRPAARRCGWAAACAAWGGGVAGSSAAADLVAGGEEEEGESRVAEDAQQPAPLWMMWRLLHARWVVCFSRV